MRVSVLQFPRKHSSPFPRTSHAIIVRNHDVADVERTDITEPNGGDQSMIQEIDFISENSGFLGNNVNFRFVD